MVKVTEKFQVTIPKEVREKVKLRPHEELDVIVLNENEILLRRRIKKVKNPLEVLIGKGEPKEEVPPEKIDEMAEE